MILDGKKLIVFLKAPRPGTVKTRLAETIGAGPACGAYHHLIGTLLGRLQSLRAVELCYSPDDALAEVAPWLREGWAAAAQGEGDLGQRLESAFNRSFAAGAERVVVIGSDGPAITAEDVGRAWAALRMHDVVLGPATDGDYWLIGLRQVERSLFHDIPWSTEGVFAASMKSITRRGLSVHVLRPLTDVDTERDWRAFLSAQ